MEDGWSAQSFLNTNARTFFLLVKGNIGPGCLALPFSFSMLGAPGSLPFLALIAFFCIGNMWLLVECKRKIPQAKTYGELGLAAFGRKGEIVVEVFLTMSQLSICCVYFSFISNGIAPLVGLSTLSVTLFTIIPAAAICQFRHMCQLAPLSIIASFLLISAMSIIVIISFQEIFSGYEPVNEPEFDSSKIIIFFVATVYAFEGIGMILPIESSMQHPSEFTNILFLSMTIVTIIYVVFGEVVVLAFGYIYDAGITKYMVTINSVKSWVASVITVFVSLAVLLSYPLQLYPAVQVIEIYAGLAIDEEQHACLYPDSSSRAGFIQNFYNKLWNTLIFFRVVRSPKSALIFGSPQYKRKRSKQIHSRHSSADENIDADPCTNPFPDSPPCERSSLLFIDNIKAQYSSLSSNCSDNGDFSVDMFDVDYYSDTHDDANSALKDLSAEDISFIRSFLRVFLVVCTALVAAFIPNVGLLVSLAGATGGTSLALIIPPCLELRVSQHQDVVMSRKRFLFCIFSIALGTLGAIVGTFFSLKNIYIKYHEQSLEANA